jgi:integrase
LTAVREYIVWRANQVIDRLPLRDERLPEARRRLESLPKRLVGDISVHRNTSKEGMDRKTQRAFLDAITPGHPTNPFSKRNQHRNQALWLLYYAGLRRSAPLTLTGRHLHLNGEEPYVFVPRVQDDKDDPRVQEPRNKTLAHPVSLTPETASTLHDFVVKHRPTYPGAKKSKYVFFSQEGAPLSIGSVDSMYLRLREKVPSLPKKFSTHTVRRTNKDNMGDAAEELGWPSELERDVVNQQSGWNRGSETHLDYERRRLRRKANKLALQMQDIATKGSSNG